MSHGPIGFHDLSKNIVKAWKTADDEMMAYCSKMCAAGMVQYKAATKEWKRKGGHLVESKKKYPQKMAKIGSNATLMQRPEEIKANKCEKKKTKDISSRKYANALLGDVYFYDTTQDEVPIPTPILSQVSY